MPRAARLLTTKEIAVMELSSSPGVHENAADHLSSISNASRPAQTTQRGTDTPAPHGHNLADNNRTLIDWPTLTWIGVLHVGALLAPFVFTWQALVLTVVLHWLTGGIGICLGFHRYFTHASFQTTRWMRWLLAWLGGLAGEGSAIDWVANHRKHHAHSDLPGDPHSPLDGKWWSHVFWLAWRYPREEQEAHIAHWAPDMNRDPILQFMKTTFLLWHFVLGGALYALGYAMGGQPMAVSFLVWGIFVRLCFVLHATWFVNSASHIWGYRNYVTTDQSRNNWWVALLTYGEGWHNNHHAFPRMAAHGHRWWEIDLTFAVIRLMQWCGLAWDVVDYKRGSDKAARQHGKRGSRPQRRKTTVSAG
jgi:stearoyl-CoA desaturase (delta-9 desaturase)